jgi:DNA-binding transcriptional LysR family regulator
MAAARRKSNVVRARPAWCDHRYLDRFRSIEAFVRVAESLSFAEAARHLGVSKSVVTTRVKQLEEFVRCALLHRTTRSVRLTEIGEAFYPECAELVGNTTRLVDRMREMKGAPAGLLRVHILPGFALGHFGKHLREFQERYPGIILDLTVSDAIIDPVREGYDCVLQIFKPVSDNLVSRRLFSWRPVFCASPAYLRAHGEPRNPEGLRRHRLGLYSRYPTGNVWEFRKGERKTRIELAPFLRTNSVHLLRDYALTDAGVVCIPTLIAAECLLAGTLRVVLPKYTLAPFWLCAVYPSAQSATLKLRLFLESLGAEPRGEDSPWDRELVARGLIPAQPSTWP